MRIVVFGAGGGIGGWICEALSEHPDVELQACIRNWSSAVRLARRGISLVRIDIADAGAVAATVAEADVVVNATMLPSAHEPALVRSLYAAATRAGVRRFIQFSSAAVYGDRTGLVAEDAGPSPNDDYSRGKAEMERLLLEGAADSHTQLIILRPSIVYGPFADFWTVRYVERVTLGKWRNLGRGGDGICNLVHAQDVARLVTAAATTDIERGTLVLNVNGPDNVTWNAYIERLGDVLGTPNRMTPSVAAFQARAALAEAIRGAARVGSLKALYRRSTGATRSAMTSAKVMTSLYPTRSEQKLLRRKARYVAEQAARTLGVTPAISLETGIQQSVAWCRVHGIV